MNEKLFKIKELPSQARIRSYLRPSLLFPANTLIRAGDLQLQVVSTNDKHDTISLKLVGIFVTLVDNCLDKTAIYTPAKLSIKSISVVIDPK